MPKKQSTKLQCASRTVYRSGLEEALGNGVLKSLEYETLSLSYSQEKKYTPDFINLKNKFLLEVKGCFRDATESRKYVDVRRCNPEWTLVFVFSDPNKPLPWAKRRSRDGKRMTHGEWAEHHGFMYCAAHSIPMEWL